MIRVSVKQHFHSHTNTNNIHLLGKQPLFTFLVITSTPCLCFYSLLYSTLQGFQGACMNTAYIHTISASVSSKSNLLDFRRDLELSRFLGILKITNPRC